MSAFIHLHVSQGYTRVFIQKQSISRFKSQILDISIYIRIGMKQFLLLLSCQDNAECRVWPTVFLFCSLENWHIMTSNG